MRPVHTLFHWKSQRLNEEILYVAHNSYVNSEWIYMAIAHAPKLFCEEVESPLYNGPAGIMGNFQTLIIVGCLELHFLGIDV